MRTRTLFAASGLTLFAAASSLASTIAVSSAVTGASDPSTTQLNYGIPNNQAFEVVGVIPVISTVASNPASMAANVFVPNAPFNLCGAVGTPTCSNDMWVAQWTIQSDSAGVRAINAFQGGTLRLVNNSGSGSSVKLRCQVGQMTGSCIFVTRFLLLTDPLF
jgi:hypothetical protein